MFFGETDFVNTNPTPSLQTIPSFPVILFLRKMLWSRFLLTCLVNAAMGIQISVRRKGGVARWVTVTNTNTDTKQTQIQM